SKTAPVLDFDWHRISHDEAKTLAPLLQHHPSPQAAGIRALASVDDIAEQLDQAVEHLLSKEVWRLSPRDVVSYIDRLWHHAGRPGGNAKRDQLVALAKPLQKQYNDSLVKAEDPLNKRIAAFNRLWKDYRSDQPGQVHLEAKLFHTLIVTPEALADLLRDPSLEAKFLARRVMNSGRMESDSEAWAPFRSARHLYTDRYEPCFIEQARRYYGGLDRLIRDEKQYRPHPLGPSFHRLLEEQLKADSVEPWVVFGWLNTQFPEDNAASIALMQKLLRSPAWKSLPFEARFGARMWFESAAMPDGQARLLAAADRELICRPLLELAENADATETAAALRATLVGLKASPVHHDILGLERLGKVAEEVFYDPLVLEHLYDLVGPMRSFATDGDFGNRLLAHISEQRDWGILHRVAAYLWRDVEVNHRNLPRVIALADEITEASPSASHTLARIGLQTIARHTRGHTYYKRDTDIPKLSNIRGKAALAMGLVEIPVPPTDPAYPIYQSQADYLTGNEDSARALLQAHSDRFLPVHRELSIPYILWVLRETINTRDEELQESVAKALLAWMQASESAFSIEQRIALEIAYGDIALQRGLLPEAQQIYSRIRRNEAYAASFDRYQAALRLARVQRIARDFDGALQTLMELDAEKIPRLVTAAHYARAEVYYAMEEYQDAAEQIAEVLERDPNHADATILRGRVQLKLDRLIEATEVELGSATAQASLVPGEMLKVTLNDPTLTVSSGGTDIEVVVTATSGDREYLLLRQFGDQKTKYRGEVRTALGEPSPDDGVLQVIGDDEVYYDYSERFRAKMVELEERRGGPIAIASDALLMASSRVLLSENEQRAADLERATAELSRGNNTSSLQRSNPERYAALLEAAVERANRLAIQTRVKPGNPIYVRVIDPDRGRTATIDELAVSVSASSGDTISRVVLKETETHSGRFEGTIQTVAAQAMARATSSETGRNPNMVISPKADYPAWRPIVSDDEQTPAFTIDLNDNADIGRMTITSQDAGSKLRAFVVETGTRLDEMTPVAIYPNNPIAVDKPWHPSVVVMNDDDRYHNTNDRSVYDFQAIQRHVATGWLTQQYALAAADHVAGPSEAFTPEIPGRVEWKRQNRHNHSHVIYRFRAYFYEPVTVTRRFKLAFDPFEMPDMHPSVAHPAEFLLAVNGVPITSADSPDKLEGAIELSPGLHRFEIWATGWSGRIGFGRGVKLLANLDDEDQLVACPDAFFDPANFPPDAITHRNAPGTVASSDDGTTFDVSFADDSRARLIRLVLVDYEGSAPAINRITLDAPGGEKLLPVANDFAELRKNDRLEIVTGDTVAIRYVDDRFVTKGMQRHERLLDVSFTNGEVEFADIDPRMQRGAMRPYHETLLRFVLDQPLPVVIHDADMDETTDPDKLTCTIENDRGETRTITLTETGPSTGTFRGWIMPVARATEKPTEIRVDQGGRLVASYRDAENLVPGVPYDRVATIVHAAPAKPRIEIAHAEIGPFEPETLPNPSWVPRVLPLNENLEPPIIGGARNERRDTRDQIATRYLVTKSFVGSDDAPPDGIKVIHGRHMKVEVVAPQFAIGEASILEVYVQTESGRKSLGSAGTGGFNINAPGTMRFRASLGAGDPGPISTLQRGGYHDVFAGRRGSAFERIRTSQREGRFRLVVPLIVGDEPSESYADPEAFKEKYRGQGVRLPYGLVAKAGETIYLGVRYRDADNLLQWATSSAKVVTRPMLDVMQEDYRSPITAAHVGENLHLRVVDPGQNKTDARDMLRVYMASKSGQKHYAILRETDFHSGIFKGVFQLTYTKAQLDEAIGEEGYDVARLGFPVAYGDTVGVRYTDGQGRKTDTSFIEVAKGSDGTIAPFSKRYDDAESAMQTQFAMAESYLELARRYRKLGEDERADRGFTRAKQLLNNTIAQFTEPETRAHAEFL
ncbi:MAG: hypothetical protein ACPGYV_05855, partial [Phycisphaeraceae bacterium]